MAPFIGVALIMVTLALMPWNFLKPVITDRIEQATGRSVAIHGDVEISLFPHPQLALHQLEISNPDWTTADHLLTAEQVTLTPSLIDLLQGELTLEKLNFSGSTLNLEQRDNAPANWVLVDERTTQSAPAENDSSSFSMPSLAVSDSTVRYWRANADSPLSVAISSLQTQAGDETLRTQATLNVQQRDIELKAQTDTVAAFLVETKGFSGDISLSAGESQLTTTFELPQAPSLQRFQASGELSLHQLRDWAEWFKLPQIALENLEIAADLERQDNQWRLHNVDASTANSQLSGELAIDTSGEAPSLDGRLHTSTVDVAALRSALPESGESQGLSIPVLPAVRGNVSIAADRLILKQATLLNLQGTLELADHSVALTPLTFDIAGGHAQADIALTSSPESVQADAQIALTQLDLSQIDQALPPGNLVSADISLELKPMEQRPTLATETLLTHLHIGHARFDYQHQNADTHLEGTLAASEEQNPPELLLNVNGTWRSKPLELQAQGAPLTRLLDLENTTLQHDYPLHVDATSNAVRVQAETTLASLLSPQTFAADMTLTADSAQQLEDWFGPVLPPLPGFRLTGELVRDHDQWSATGLEGRIGSTQVNGSIEVLSGERPLVEVDLEAGRIYLAQLIERTTPTESEEAENESFLAPLRTFDGQLSLNANTLVLPNGLALNDLTLAANLEAGQLEAEPVRFRLGDGSLSASLTLDAAQPPASGHLDIDVDNIALSRLSDTFTPIEDRLGRVSGELHLEMSESLPSERRDDLLLPFIGRLKFEPSELSFSDPQADTDLTLSIESQAQTFHMQGEGHYDSAPASFNLHGDPLLNARDPNRLYAVDLEADIVDTHIRLDGTLLRPLELEGLNLQLALEGPNPQRLSRLLGISLPELPAYSVTGELDLEDQRWTFTDIQGVIGGSDLNGHLALDTNVSPLHVSGELSSTHLNIEDLGLLAGETPEETSNKDRFILPDTEIITEAWQGVSADVSYRGQSVRADGIPLSNVVIDFVLKEGRGRFEPIGFGVGEGKVDLILDLKTKTHPPSGTLQVEVQRVDLNAALRHWNLADESVGIIGGRGKLWIEGSSIAELLASADGGVVLLMNDGRLDALLVEIAGLDAGQTFLSWARGRDPIPIDCAYADLQARDGVTQLDTFVVDTGDTTFTLGGQVDLNTERLDISIIAHPKDPSVFVGRSPLHLGGTFDNIETGVHREALVMRAGASVALGALTGPITALLPLVEVGTGPSMQYCQGLISRSRDAIQEGDME
ncbi:AsmA family protein [Halomonas sp. KO116]|uniref:AsmA family protein n=1 Tax=Halomonas sp. KO116 TaxID=1504981 RepID=UPI0004E32B43|nr:AsmA family protein [Halomonas sp. KO116]AJY48990.1 AsmA family protein [Halomonas sp. KO116]